MTSLKPVKNIATPNCLLTTAGDTYKSVVSKNYIFKRGFLGLNFNNKLVVPT